MTNTIEVVPVAGVLLHVERMNDGTLHTLPSGRSVRVGREWRVTVARIDQKTNSATPGEYLGTIAYDMMTRERKPQGLRYVTARWSSPGWRLVGGYELRSKTACLEDLARDYLRSDA